MMKHLVALAVLFVAATTVEAQYSRATALTSYVYARAAYCDTGDISSWSCPICDTDLTQITLFENSTTGILAYTGYDSSNNQVVIAWRGSSNIPNWFQDLDAIFIDYPLCSGCQVHQGFYDTFISLWNYGMATNVGNLMSSYGTAEILITGHSLGAATALHTAVTMAQDFPSNTQTYYTFGEPRVGNPAFVAWAGTVMPQVQYRITHESDPVPHVPTLDMGYLQVPHEVWFNNDGNTTYTVCNDSFTAEDPNCSDSTVPVDIYDHLFYMGACTHCANTPDILGHC